MKCRKQVEHFGYKVHSIEGRARGDGRGGCGDVTACMESIEAMGRWTTWCGFGAVQIREQGISPG